ncbi:MAG: flavin-dependent dehydrogenase [Leptolyngbyaceae cyanobacterium T60_A2020_046]|nr:flavin-dependent dehydrogenase [Leptolyngbyaceae cyanobacterium T60_A2020_046]
MKELLYLEIPTPETPAVTAWLHNSFMPSAGQAAPTPDGLRIEWRDRPASADEPLPAALSVLVWSLQRTTYLKVFRWGRSPLPGERAVLKQLETEIRAAFPPTYPQLPPFDPQAESIFDALAAAFPKTVTYFQRMPNGEADLERVYWWEKRWRESVQAPQAPRSVIYRAEEVPAELRSQATIPSDADTYDLVYIGGALGVIHAAVMASLGYRVLLIERLPFGRMHREWNISRVEIQSLIDLGLLTTEEFETLIAREYEDGFNKFFDANNPDVAKAPVLHTPTVLNIAVDSDALLKRCGEKFLAAGGTIWDETEFEWAEVTPEAVTIHGQHRKTGDRRSARSRLLVDAMGTASPIAWQLTGGRAFDSVCPTVGACISGGIDYPVWDSTYGDVLFSHGDISRGRQLIWELFPAKEKEVTVYLFHYHQVHPENPGSLLTMYEDFFHILPEYRRCNLDKLTWRKPTFGYIPGYFSLDKDDRTVAFDRLVAIGDAASLQSPLVFTGFGSLVRNLPRLTELLHVALQNDLLQARHLNQIRAYQSNIAVTWLFSKGMMVPTGASLPPARVNSMLNTFFGILEAEDPDLAERFIKDRATWGEFNRLALSAATQNPALLGWIWQLAGPKDMARWVGSYVNYTLQTFLSWLFAWLPAWVSRNRAWLEKRYPAFFLWLLAQSYHLTYGMGRPLAQSPIRIQAPEISPSPAQPRVPASAIANNRPTPEPDTPTPPVSSKL